MQQSSRENQDKPTAHLFVKEPLNLLSVVKKAPGFCNVHKTVTLCGVFSDVSEAVDHRRETICTRNLWPALCNNVVLSAEPADN